MFQPNGGGSGRVETLGANPSGATVGTTATASGSVNTKGSWVSLGTSSFAYECFLLSIAGASTAANYTLDLGINDGSGNINILATDIYVPATANSGAHGLNILLPVHVPAGSDVSIRVQCTTASGTIQAVVNGFSDGIGGAPGFSRCVCLSTISASRGTTIDPGATINTNGSWTQIIASTAEQYKALMGIVGNAGDTARAAVGFACMDVGIGAGGSEVEIVKYFTFEWGSSMDSPMPAPRIYPFAFDAPAGSRLAARGACSINTAGDRTWDLCLYGFAA